MHKKKDTHKILVAMMVLKLSYQPSFNMVMVVVIVFNMHSNQLIDKEI
jgi:hypothetical protein